MKGLSIIEHNGERVLTTAQLAEAFDTDTNTITVNFNRNRDRYEEGKHFFLLQGDALAEFKRNLTNCNVAPNINRLYLWTEKGAWMAAKSVNTDRAWAAYEALVDDYYIIKQTANVIPLDERQVRLELLKTAIDHEERLAGIEDKIALVEKKVDEQITLDSGEQRALQKAVARKVYGITPVESERRRLFKELYREIKDRWAVPSYKDVRRTELQEVLRYVEAWRPRAA